MNIDVGRIVPNKANYHISFAASLSMFLVHHQVGGLLSTEEGGFIRLTGISCPLAD